MLRVKIEGVGTCHVIWAFTHPSGLISLDESYV